MSTSTVKDSFTVAKGWRKRGGGRIKLMNTTQTEALKLALEALEDWNSPLDPQPDADIITAIKEALSSPNGEAHPEQEPAAWESILGAIARGWCYEENANKTIDKDLAEAIAKEVYSLGYTIPPPVTESHKRKPLTDEQIDAIADKFTVHTGEMWEPELCIEFNDSCKSVHSFARAIEAAHGIKE